MRACRTLHRGQQQPERRCVAYVADDQPAAGREEFHGLAQDAVQVGDAREVLHHGVEYDRVEPGAGQPREVVGRLDAQPDPVAVAGLSGLPPDPLHDRGRDVGAPVRVDLADDPGE